MEQTNSVEYRAHRWDMDLHEYGFRPQIEAQISCGSFGTGVIASPSHWWDPPVDGVWIDELFNEIQFVRDGALNPTQYAIQG